MYPCWACKGSKKCAQCHGAKRTRSAIDGREIPCPVCGATGICNVCNGSGRSATRTPEEEMDKLGVPKSIFEKSSSSSSSQYRNGSTEKSYSAVWGWAIGLGILCTVVWGFGGLVLGAIIGAVIGYFISKTK